MAVDESVYPDHGTISVAWTVTMVDGRRRLGWSVVSDPRIDAGLAIALLRDVAAELEEDQPS